MRVRRGGAVLVVAGLGVWGLGGVAAGATSVTVTPSTNLVDGQLVSVSISGFPASTDTSSPAARAARWAILCCSSP